MTTQPAPAGRSPRLAALHAHALMRTSAILDPQSMDRMASDLVGDYPDCARAWELKARYEREPAAKLEFVRKGIAAHAAFVATMGEEYHGRIEEDGKEQLIRLHRIGIRAAERLGFLAEASGMAFRTIELQEWLDEIDNEEAMRVAFLAGDLELADSIAWSDIIDASCDLIHAILVILRVARFDVREKLDATTGAARIAISYLTDPEFAVRLADAPATNPKVHQALAPALPFLVSRPDVRHALAVVCTLYLGGDEGDLMQGIRVERTLPGTLGSA